MTANGKRIWCSGIIVPSHGTDQGSIPWMRIVSLYFAIFYSLWNIISDPRKWKQISELEGKSTNRPNNLERKAADRFVNNQAII